MARKKKSRSKHDLRRIKTTRVYRVSEFAAIMQVSVATVRRWINNGLPNMGSGSGGLIDGAEAKTWLLKWRQSKKSKCGHNQMYCLRCKLPRLPIEHTLGVQPQGKNRLLISGRCSACNAKIFRGFSKESAGNYLQTLRSTKTANHSLIGNTKALSDERRDEVQKTNHQLNGSTDQIELNFLDPDGAKDVNSRGDGHENQ